MAMSNRFYQAATKTVTENFVIGQRQTPIIEITDFRLLALIQGINNSLQVKKQYLEAHTFPDHGDRYLRKAEEEIENLEQRLVDLTEEKERRGL